MSSKILAKMFILTELLLFIYRIYTHLISYFYLSIKSMDGRIVKRPLSKKHSHIIQANIRKKSDQLQAAVMYCRDNNIRGSPGQ